MADRFDVVVIGAGPAGEHALDVLLDAGKKVALVERESIGGECSGWACMPTKTLLRPTEVQGEADRRGRRVAALLRLAEDPRLPTLASDDEGACLAVNRTLPLPRRKR